MYHHSALHSTQQDNRVFIFSVCAGTHMTWFMSGGQRAARWWEVSLPFLPCLFQAVRIDRKRFDLWYLTDLLNSIVQHTEPSSLQDILF